MRVFQGFFRESLMCLLYCQILILNKLILKTANILIMLNFSYSAKFEAMLFALCRNEENKASIRTFLEVRLNLDQCI